MIRIALVSAACLSCIWGPWWLTLIFLLALATLYTAWEVPFIGLAADLIWRPALGLLHPVPLMLIASLIIVWVCEPIRRRFFIH